MSRWRCSPRWDANGLITAVATVSDAVLMAAHMNIAALAVTLPTGEAHCWSRSHAKHLPKGAASVHIQHAAEMRIDFHEDTIRLQI
ncbi:MAG: phosphoribosyl-AMP cyclohydrolase, partial [Sandarakinorhabdus sp.]|nr:phosphoribosyl-AMP cyclohydrolase [Sandarakinorhabdus sp.]